MRCKDCKYNHIRRYGEDDFREECDPPNGICPYQEEWLKEVAESARTGKPVPEDGLCICQTGYAQSKDGGK